MSLSLSRFMLFLLRSFCFHIFSSTSFTPAFLISFIFSFSCCSSLLLGHFDYFFVFTVELSFSFHSLFILLFGSYLQVPICRICHETANEEGLMEPCDCKGSVCPLFVSAVGFNFVEFCRFRVCYFIIILKMLSLSFCLFLSRWCVGAMDSLELSLSMDQLSCSKHRTYQRTSPTPTHCASSYHCAERGLLWFFFLFFSCERQCVMHIILLVVYRHPLEHLSLNCFAKFAAQNTKSPMHQYHPVRHL